MLFASGSAAVMGYESGRLPTRLDIGPPLPQAPGAPRGYDIMLTAKRLVVCLAAAAIAQSGCVTAADRQASWPAIVFDLVSIDDSLAGGVAVHRAERD